MNADVRGFGVALDRRRLGRAHLDVQSLGARTLEAEHGVAVEGCFVHRAPCRLSIPRVAKGFFKVTPLGLHSRAVERRI